jgi:hypothetical protein
VRKGGARTYSTTTGPERLPNPTGLTNLSNFSEIHRNVTESVSPNSKIGEFWNSNSIFLKKNKNTLKTRWNSKITSEEIFANM